MLTASTLNLSQCCSIWKFIALFSKLDVENLIIHDVSDGELLSIKFSSSIKVKKLFIDEFTEENDEMVNFLLLT